MIRRSSICPAWQIARGAPRGYTLLEAVVSLVIISTIMAAVTSTMLLASRAIGNSSSGGIGKMPESSEIAEQIASDLSLALAFSERSDTAVEFTVPDRDGDGQVENIRYAWSGTAGDPLTRRYNGGPQAVLADNIHHFNLAYMLKTVEPAVSQPPEESDEVILIYHDDRSGGSLKSQKIKSNEWCAQYFMPALPDNAISWKVTRVEFRAKKSGSADGVFAVQIRAADGNQKPTTTVLAEATVNESSLSSSYEWVTLAVGPVGELDPSAGYCVVVKHVSGGREVAKIEYEKDGSPMTPDSHWMKTTNAGASWSNPEDKKDMRFFVHGTYTTEGAPQWP